MEGCVNLTWKGKEIVIRGRLREGIGWEGVESEEGYGDDGQV